MKTQLDKRFTITKEFYGHLKPGYIIRFCDEFIDKAETKKEAIEIAKKYNDKRMAEYN